ncbi:MAG: hypothetical protein O2783_06535 [Chloroflexi bacterium]|nr:hypothetical protein [Chloroflexota bacterium]
MAADKALVGNAGEHYVAFQLSGRGYAVGLTAQSTEGIDLLAANNKTHKAVTIQVKTMKTAEVTNRKWGVYWKWRIGRHLADPAAHSENLFLAFVDLRGGPSQTSPHPDVFVVPSDHLGNLVEVEQYPTSGPPRDFWCNIYEKKRPNYKYKKASNYKNRWDLIEAALA